MSAHTPEQDLLLLAHNELSPIRRLLAQWHLRRCSECRARLARLTGLSQEIAAALRPADLPAWKPATPGGFRIAHFPPIALLLMTALLLVLLSSVVVVTVHAHSPAHRTITSSNYGPCRPDLPNSSCR